MLLSYSVYTKFASTNIWVPGPVDILTWHIKRVNRTGSVRHAGVQVEWRFSFACSQASPGDVIFPLHSHFKFARDIGNEPVQETDGEKHKVLKDDDETKSNGENEEVLSVEIVRLDAIKVLFVPVKPQNKLHKTHCNNGKVIRDGKHGLRWTLSFKIDQLFFPTERYLLNRCVLLCYPSQCLPKISEAFKL